MTLSRSAFCLVAGCLLWGTLFAVIGTAQETEKAGGQDAAKVAKAEGHEGVPTLEEQIDEVAHGEHDVHMAHAVTVRGKPHGKFGQLPEFLYVDPILAAWTFALFTVLYFVLKFFAWKPIIAAMEARDHAIEAAQQQAKQLRDEAQALLAQHEQEMGRAHEEAKQLLEQARESATRECEELIAKARLQAAQAHEKAEADIESAKVQALQEVRESAVDLAARIAGKVVGKDLSGGNYSTLAEEVKS